MIDHMKISYETYEWFSDAYSAQLDRVVEEFLSRQAGETQPWSVMPYYLVKKVHDEFMNFGFVHSEKILERLLERVYENVIRLQINTELMEHEAVSIDDVVSSYGLTKEDFNDYPDWVTDENGSWRISDQMKPLVSLIMEMHQEKIMENKLVLLNRLLNRVHQRSDLASWFVEGGSHALSQLSAKTEKTEMVMKTQLQNLSPC
jgi:hypothetical protein